MTSYQIKLEDCSGAKDEDYIKYLFFALIEGFSLNIRAVTEHSFYPIGLSIATILSESHAFMHTYPEKDRVDIDLHLCGDIEHGFTERLFDEISRLFRPGELKYIITDRICMDVIDQGNYEAT